MGRLVYQTLRENVADAIRMKILNHEVPMGARIIEQEIAAELGVSRGPVREALRQLEQEGLLEYTRNAGCSVKKITLEDIYEIYLLRATYEVLAAKLCGGQFSKETLKEMEKALIQMEHLEEKDFDRAIALDNMLHHAIVQETKLPRLVKSWSDLNYGNVISYYEGSPDRKAAARRQYPIHEKLFQVCCTGKCPEICQAIMDHYMLAIHRRMAKQGISEKAFQFPADLAL